MKDVGFLPEQWPHPKARALPFDKSHKAELLPTTSQPYKVFILCACHGAPFDLFNPAAAQTMHTHLGRQEKVCLPFTQESGVAQGCSQASSSYKGLAAAHTMYLVSLEPVPTGKTPVLFLHPNP